jgi:crotonobetainyl-CoA:carnitine CoA-transferase CaiB-like acyl-CoA transferase
MSKVLQGVRVLDFGRFIAGPFCGALLADYGADVIRIEEVGGSDDRFLTPVTESGEGSFFLHVNRNKRSIALDISRPEGQEIVKRLVRGADVVIANMPLSTLKRLGLDYESLRAIKPDIILTAATAFGLHESVRERVGFDGIGQAICGAVHMSGFTDQPVKAMVPVIDFGTALSCALGTMMALYHKQNTGVGQEVRASLLNTGLNFASGTLIEEAVLHLDRKATGNRAPTFGPSDIFRTRDGWLITQVIGATMFKRWATLVEKAELIDDPRFRDDLSRGEHGELLSAYMSDWCAGRTLEQALAELEKARIPAGPVLSPRQVLESDLVSTTGAITWMTYPGTPQKIPIAPPPVELSHTPPQLQSRAPLAGEHTLEILEEVGYQSADIQRLEALGII